jgi:hypothetical protein
MKIDWSKAPVGSTHLSLPNSPNQRPVFWRVEDEIALEAWAMEPDLHEVKDHFRYGPEGCPSFIAYSAISKPENWNGEGLPPVGTVCEFAGFNPEETLPSDPAVGDNVTVIAHYLSGCVQVAAFTFNSAADFGSLRVAQGAHGCFRPIRTPEQIAEEQRLAAINKIVEDSMGRCDVVGAGYLYDAQYRQQVKP